MDKPNISHLLMMRVEARVNHYVQLAAQTWPGCNLPTITVTYRPSGTSAGLAYCHLYQLNFHPVLLLENIEEFFESIIGHEVAHLVSTHLHGHDIADHGSEWADVMRAFGLPPDRCHRLDTTNVERVITRWKHKCKCPGKVHRVSSRTNRHIMTGGECGIICQICASRLKPIDKHSRVKGLPDTLQHETKIVKAQWVMRHHNGKPRSQLISLLMELAGLTKAGASTYYYNLSRRVD